MQVRNRSLTVWFAPYEGALYIAAADAARKRWPAEVEQDGRVRIRIAGRLYDRRLVRIQDEALGRAAGDVFEPSTRSRSARRPPRACGSSAPIRPADRNRRAPALQVRDEERRHLLGEARLRHAVDPVQHEAVGERLGGLDHEVRRQVRVRDAARRARRESLGKAMRERLLAAQHARVGAGKVRHLPEEHAVQLGCAAVLGEERLDQRADERAEIGAAGDRLLYRREEVRASRLGVAPRGAR